MPTFAIRQILESKVSIDATGPLSGRVEAGTTQIRLHDFRHTAASMLLDGGASVLTVAKWLGHDPPMTLRVYGHVYDDTLASAGDALLGGSRASGTEQRTSLGVEGDDICHCAQRKAAHQQTDGSPAPCPTLGLPGGSPTRWPDRRNAVELQRCWWARTVSNRRPLVCKTRALPLSYAPVLGQATRRRRATGNPVSPPSAHRAPASTTPDREPRQGPSSRRI